MEAGDGPAWQRVFASVGEDGLWIGAEPPVPQWGDAMVDEYVGSERDVMFLAEVDGAVIGWLSAKRGDDEAELGMGIVEEFRGQGIGSALMDAVIEWAGSLTLVLRVFPHNERALALYRKYGFEERPDKAGVWPRRNGDFWDLVFMQRTARPI